MEASALNTEVGLADIHPPVQLTRFTSRVPNRLAKSYNLEAGELKKTSAGQMVAGEYEVLTIQTAGELAGVVMGLEHNQALGYGLPQCSNARGTIASRKKAAPGELTRTRENFDWWKGPAILFVDYDPPPGAVPLTALEFWQTIIAVCPALATAPAVIISSASGFICNANTGEELKGAGGWHAYIIVADGRDIPRAGQAIYAMSWLAGHGRFDISSAGTLQDRSLVDAAVWQPERLDFAAGAFCTPPLEQRRPEPLILNPTSAPFDTHQLPTVPASGELEQLKAGARAAVADEAKLVRAAWVEARVAADMRKDTGTDPEKREENAEKLRRTYRRGAEEMVLQGDFELFTEDGPHVTVDELLDNPEKWDKKRFSDPLEPSYRNDNRIAIAYLRPGKKPVIQSYAHGGQSFFLARHNASVATVATVSVADWQKPLPLIVRKQSDPYPQEFLPGVIGAAVREVVDFVQCPVALAACSALAVVSTVGQGLVDVRRADKLEGPTSLNLLAIADSGERKTSVDGHFSKPLQQWEAEQAEAAKPDLKKNDAAMASWEAKQTGLLAAIKDATKRGKVTADLEKRVADLEAEKPKPPKVPRLLHEDTTPEALAFRLAKGWPVGGVLSSEAGTVFGGHAMGKDSAMRNMGLLNKLWDGGQVTVDRKSVESFIIRGARLTMGLAAQSETVRAFLDSSKGLARGIGFLARFLIAWPESTQGDRMYKAPPEHWPHLAAFHRQLGTLLNCPLPFNDRGELTPKTLELSPDAKKEWVQFYNDVEEELRPGRDMAEARDVASKAADNAARLAALFHVFENGLTGTISQAHMSAAREIVVWHLFEALRFLGEIGHSKELTNAATLDAWLIAHCRKGQVGQISRRDIQRIGPNPIRGKADLDRALEELTDAGRVRLVQEGRQNLVEVNPALLEAGHVLNE